MSGQIELRINDRATADAQIVTSFFHNHDFLAALTYLKKKSTTLPGVDGSDNSRAYFYCRGR